MAHTTADDLTFVSFPIEKFEEDGDGNLIVVGKASDGSVDSDRQIVDPSWSAKALADWHESGGNVRVMHNPALYPAGRSLSLETSSDGHTVKSLIAEPVAQRLVKNRVLRAYSVGIAEPVIDRDMTGKAPGGIIRGGRIVELSLVDRPANKNCQLTLAKAEGLETDWTVGDLTALLEKAEKAEAADVVKDEEPGEAAHDPADPNQPGAEEVDESDVVKAAGDSGQDDSGVAAGDADQDDDAGDDDGGEAVKMAGDAYRVARREWLGREPSVKGIAGGTEYLAARGAWHQWNGEGEAGGLDGTREGAMRWLAKHSAAPELTKVAAEDMAKRDFSQAERDSAADSGAAMSDGSFPIKTREDLKNAVHLAGHAKDPSAARAHIKRRAAALGAPDMIPDSWKTETADISLTGLADLIKADGAAALEAARVMLGGEQWEAVAKNISGGGYAALAAEDFAAVLKAGADSDMPPGKQQCPTCKGDGKIKGGNVTCPDCKGKGKVKPTKAKKIAAVTALTETVTKAVEAGLITEKAAGDILHQVGPAGGPLHQSGPRPLPADAAAVPRHREPDGTSGVEQLEHDAGLPTQADAVADKVPASVDDLQMKSDAPYAVARMHDAFCAAWSGDEVLGDYPSLKSVADAADDSWFSGLGLEAAKAEDGDAASMAYLLAGTARAVKAMDPAAVADGRADLHKAFSDMYPSQKVKPSDPRKPGSFQRPYLSAGHASQQAGSGTNVPPSTDVPAPQQFDRGYLTEGHAAPSPADSGPNNRVAPTTAASRTYYTNSAKDAARAAMQSMHDHIAIQHPDLCPMAPSKSVMPPDLGSHNVPQPKAPMAMGGVGGMGKGADASANEALREQNTEAFGHATPPKKRKKKLTKAEFFDYAARHGITTGTAAQELQAPAMVPAPDPLAIKALVAEQLTPLTEHYERQLAELRSQVDKLGSQPDPAMAPVRGQMSRPGTAAPVEKRSLIDEARERAEQASAAERRDFIDYMTIQSRSPDPNVREKALSVLEKMDTGIPA